MSAPSAGSSGPALLGLGRLVVRRKAAGAGAQGLLQRRRAAVLAQEVGEGLVGQLLQRLHTVLGEKLQRVPRLGIERDQLAMRSGVRPLSTTVVHDTHLGRKGSDPAGLKPLPNRAPLAFGSRRSARMT